MQVVQEQNSIVQSLSELREIENQRIVEERAAAEQRARDEEEARARAEHEAKLAVEQARLEAEREARLKIEAAAAAELARQQIALAHTRMEEELLLRRAALAKTRPTWMVAVTCVAAAAAGVLVWWALSMRSIAAEAKDQTEVAKRDKDEAKRAALEAQKEVERIEQGLASNNEAIQGAMKRLALAQNQADREKVAADLRRAEAHRRELEAARQKAAHDAWLIERGKKVVISADCQNGVFGAGCTGH